MIGESQAMSPADKYAAYLKGFKPFSVKRKIYNPRSSSDEQHGAKVCCYRQKGTRFTQKRLIIWSGFKNLFENCDVTVMYNDEEKAFVLMPADFGLSLRHYTGTTDRCINNATLVDAIMEKYDLKPGTVQILRTKRVGDLLFIYDPKTPI